jgi:hypothetical protein
MPGGGSAPPSPGAAAARCGNRRRHPLHVDEPPHVRRGFTPESLGSMPIRSLRRPHTPPQWSFLSPCARSEAALLVGQRRAQRSTHNYCISTRLYTNITHQPNSPSVEGRTPRELPYSAARPVGERRCGCSVVRRVRRHDHEF